jgi:ribokinase
MNPSVVVIGSFVQDLVFHCEEFPPVGVTTLGNFATGPGGKGSNQAVAAARAGATVHFIGAVGRDAFAESAALFHQSEGIHSHLIPKSSHRTGCAAITVDHEGRNQIVVAIGASAHLKPVDVPTALIARARVVVAQHEASVKTNAHAFRRARTSGVTTVLNPAPMRPDFDPGILGDVDILIPNESEFTTLLSVLGIRLPSFSNRAVTGRSTAPKKRPTASSEPPPLAIETIHDLARQTGVPVVIVTLGERGCAISTPAGAYHLPAHRVKARDTTGAGDAFVGAFAAGLVQFNGDVLKAAEFGNAAAALSVTRPGTAASMPSARAIRILQRQQPNSAIKLKTA